MPSEAYSSLINYYEYLNVDEDASPAELQKAYAALVISTQQELNNQLTMQSALYKQNVVLPGIEQHILKSAEARTSYNQQIAAAQRKLQARNNLADDEGLDDPLPRPFVFDMLKGDDYDTEMPAYTLREIAQKMDNEWARAAAWLADRSEDNHVFVAYLAYVAHRGRLAGKIKKIISDVAGKKDVRIHANAGLERCINILDPSIERPTVAVYSPEFDGKVFEAGEFLADQPATSELLLRHEGTRGCVFGSMESRTDWLRLGKDQTRIYYMLMPEGTDPAICASEVRIRLNFHIAHLPRNADYTAHLVVRMENQQTPREILVQVHLESLPLPPRVSFIPAATREHPLWFQAARRGARTNVVVAAQNAGDERLTPLSGHISTREPGAGVSPARFRANEPVTLIMNTAQLPYGQVYDLVFDVQYDSPDALGPAALYLRGEILPTPWQSLLREKSFGERFALGTLAGFSAGFVGMFLGAALAVHRGFWWLFFLLVPAAFAWFAQLIVRSLIAHIHRSGDSQIRQRGIQPALRWGVPIAFGLLLTGICALISDPASAVTVSSVGWFLVGYLTCFMFDKAHVG